MGLGAPVLFTTMKDGSKCFSHGEADGAPLIYASMGTLVNGMEHVYGTILEAIGQVLPYRPFVTGSKKSPTA